jgi:hypothetical protein
MPSSYPTSIDSFTDPTAGEFLNAPSHSTQHADVNDAVEAIETFVGTASAPKFAPTTSPTFVGTPTAPTAPVLTNTTQLANTAFVTGAVATEATNRTNAVALKANIASPTFTGVPAGPTAANGTNTTQLATTAFVLANVGSSEFEGTFVYDIRNYGTVDPTGVVDSTSAILAAIAAAAANAQGGVVWLGAGLFKVSSALTVNSNTISIVGAGNAATILEPTSALNGGVVLTIQMNPFQSGVNYFSAGTFAGFTIDGTNTTSAVGLQFGDVVGGRLDISVNNFRGSGGIGVNFVNTTNWTEENFIRLYVNLNTVGCKFGLVGSGSNSFGYNDIDIYMNPGGGSYNGQVGIQISTTALLYHGKLRVRGNLTGTGAIGIEGITSGTTYGGIRLTDFNIAFECASGTVPLQFPNYFLFCGNGVVDTTGSGSLPDSTCEFTGFVVFSGWWNVPGFTPGSGIWVNDASGSQPTVAGVLALTNGTDTSATATPSAPTFVSGTALQLNTTQDTMLYVEVTTAASLEIQMGSTSSVGTTLISTITAALGMETIRVPKGWYVKITGTIADLNINAVSC